MHAIASRWRIPVIVQEARAARQTLPRPAFAIVMAALLMRLPTRPLRWGAIALLVGVNLTQFAGRVSASEPPTDRLARDLMDAQPNAGLATRTYARLTAGMGVRPGEG